MVLFIFDMKGKEGINNEKLKENHCVFRCCYLFSLKWHVKNI